MVRPREFNKEDALRKAMHLFWTKGYEGTSMTDLTETMGISRSSLYETFGDKRDLFLAALNYYQDHNDVRKAGLISDTDSVRQNLKRFLESSIHFALNENLPGGCFITNTATAMGTLDEQIRSIIQSRLKKQEEFFYTLLEQGFQSGEIGPEKDIRALARFYVGLLRGMTVIARVNPERKMLEDIVNIGLQAID